MSRPKTNVNDTGVFFSMEEARRRLRASFRVSKQKDPSLKDGLFGQFYDGSCVVYSNDEEVCRKLAEIFNVERNANESQRLHESTWIRTDSGAAGEANGKSD